jgi:hypothetical protein
VLGTISKTVVKQLAGKLKRQPAVFSSDSLESIYLPTKLAFHARSSPDGFLFSFPARLKIIPVLKMLTLFSFI